LLFLVVVGLLACPQAWAYVVADPWCQTACGDWAVWTDPSCTVSAVCNRTEGAPFFSVLGTWAPLYSGGTLKCNTCCSDCYTDNQPTETHTCLENLSISTSRSFSFTIAPGISGDLTEVIKAQLQFQFGWSSQTTFSSAITAGSSTFPSCKIGRYRAVLAVYTGATCNVWSAFSWIITSTGPNPPCSSTPTYICNLGLGYNSTCTSARWGDATMEWLGNSSCP
jgi:hypothetical protein